VGMDYGPAGVRSRGGRLKNKKFLAPTLYKSC
jgi:hypothetical protein